MKFKTAGVLMVLIGIVMMIYTGFDYSVDKKVFDSGNVKVFKEQTNYFHWPPFIGVVVFVLGIIIIIRDRFTSED